LGECGVKDLIDFYVKVAKGPFIPIGRPVIDLQAHHLVHVGEAHVIEAAGNGNGLSVQKRNNGDGDLHGL